MEFSEKQRQVVDHRNGSLLVAAAAGSGKTTTLIAHITEQLLCSEPEKRGDLRRMIVVTYTNAAAAEMKNRLVDALTEELKKRPEDAWLRLQAGLVPQSHICTVDSLCGFLVRNYFNKIDVAPDLRIGDESELELLKEDVLDELLEERYKAADPEFLDLIRAYGTEKSDVKVRDMIRTLYDASRNDPFPEDWLAGAFPPCPKTAEELRAQNWVDFRREKLADEIGNIRDMALLGLRRAEEESAVKYIELFKKDLQCLDTILRENDYDGRRAALLNADLDGKVRRSKNNDPGFEDLMEALRGAKSGYPKDLKELKAKYARDDAEECRLLALTEGPQRALLSLTGEFARRFAEEKKTRNIAEFIDMEHFALKLLVEKTEDGQILPTAFAKDLQKDFDEIIVDEYQDINNVQEYILRALSGEAEGRPNLFMVGDVKQSIYRFRRANPAIFMEKYAAFGREKNDPHRVIDLSENYRSRAAVLEGANDLFRRVMTRAYGGIDYDEDARLNPAARYPEGDKLPELLLFEDAGSAEENARAEAALIGRKIRQLFAEGTTVWSAKKQEASPLRRRDIVILMRSRSSIRLYAETLGAMGIPVSAQEKHGFYDTQEVQTALAFLTVIDNPRQDIPLASVMTSAAFGFTEPELADIVSFARSAGVRKGLYEAVNAAAGHPERFGKATAFLKSLARWRADAEVTDIPGLMHRLLEDTGLGLYLRALPGGDVRLANLELLLDKARQFEKTSYRGLASFLRYVERTREAGEDEGEASMDSEADDVVRIASIHGVKGLEFPVVFLAGTAVRFNLRDTSAELLTDGTAGAALVSRDTKARVKSDNLRIAYLKDRLIREAKAEELRVLYVALTRASERLILTGWKKDADKWQDAYPSAAEAGDAPLSPHLIGKAGCFLDWILSAAAAGTPHLEVKVVPEEAKVLAGLADRLSLAALRDKMAALRQDNGPVSQELTKRVMFDLPHRGLRGVRGVQSVSALKKAAEAAADTEKTEDEREEALAVENSNPVRIPGKPGGLKGADRGTVYHKVMERIPPERADDPAVVRDFLRKMREDGLLSDAELRTVEIEDITAFFGSPMGERVRKAAAAGRLHREQPFILGVPLRELQSGTEEEETVLIQGIIDMYFTEDDRLILVDYKTDRVRRPEELSDRYRVQLDWYGRALRQALDRPVGECYIYSFSLRRWIPLAQEKEAVL